ncbi:uncharacterized protein HMPREF1541_03578 [Cyphellophora europaea CBS 101466]|uniref:Uncharacterized protein n=1 Tax=Cyphellophora europaea (strain CBS 101466) TaxID=1220924 RepID=W2RYW3_CYPE1|nr:uncharacterized protein HMPREF1541_03578 [Cyphellophora europaea CBS 101466]ETN41642.1 hypothetical protein HMPREF1541_03578 [Cyphellophora europaea CBS 101466]
MPGAQEYFSHFSPTSISATLSNGTSKLLTKLRTEHDIHIPSLNPLYYLDPRTIRAYLSDPKAFRNALRLIVIVAAYLLMRPHLETLLRKVSGAPERREEALKARVRELRGREGEGRKDK